MSPQELWCGSLCLLVKVPKSFLSYLSLQYHCINWSGSASFISYHFIHIFIGFSKTVPFIVSYTQQNSIIFLYHNLFRYSSLDGHPKATGGWYSGQTASGLGVRKMSLNLSSYTYVILVKSLNLCLPEVLNCKRRTIIAPPLRVVKRSNEIMSVKRAQHHAWHVVGAIQIAIPFPFPATPTPFNLQLFVTTKRGARNLLISLGVQIIVLSLGSKGIHSLITSDLAPNSFPEWLDQFIAPPRRHFCLLFSFLLKLTFTEFSQIIAKIVQNHWTFLLILGFIRKASVIFLLKLC